MEEKEAAAEFAGTGAAVTPDESVSTLAGWTLDASERRDFYHRIRVIPPEVRAWRKRMVNHAMSNPERFPAVGKNSAVSEVREQVDAGTSFLREVARILAALHGTPRLGNHDDPVDELVYIILARKTREGAYQEGFATLKETFQSWDELLDAQVEQVEKLVESGGLGGTKTATLYAALSALQGKFGNCTLQPARDWSNDKIAHFLCSLPGIQKKSAYCVMLYSMGRKVFPVDAHCGRIFTRLSPYRELGLDLSGLDHKKLQVVLDDLVPPNLRYSLHVNMVAHGRRCCRSRAPDCGRCELSKLCAHHRAEESSQATRSKAPTVVDLFCGAGGMSSGFVREGFKVVLALDNDPVALRTYRLNHPSVPDERIVCRDITEMKDGDARALTGGEDIDVLVGAPPCQGFSHVGFRCKRNKTGYRLSGDERNYLFEYLISVVLKLRPKLVLMENVPGMKSARREKLSFFETAARSLEDLGDYRTAIWRVNAASLGVPQDRIRYFLVASRLGAMPGRPEEDYQDLHAGNDFDVDALPPVTLEEAIFDLPPKEADTGEGMDYRTPPDIGSDKRYRRYLKKFSIVRESPFVYNHAVRFHNNNDLELYSLLRPGEDSVHAIERHGRADLMRYRRDVFDDKYARLRGTRPGKTIVAHLAKDGNGYIHPSQTRSITVREGARIQSFGDDFIFCGSHSDQWRQLGNAVPPLVAAAFARSFGELLEYAGAGSWDR